jgi:hypothetical protein
MKEKRSIWRYLRKKLSAACVLFENKMFNDALSESIITFSCGNYN